MSPRKMGSMDKLPVDINEELMIRLATGSKALIDRKSMKMLTVKNYEKLPENIKKKQDAIKLEEQKALKEKAAMYQKELNIRLR
jgi:hypothetical protein